MAASREHERRWPASLAVLAVLGLQSVPPQQVAAGPRWLPPALELALLVPIVATNVATAALALWEIDQGGPYARDPRHRRPSDRPDLLLPQMTGVHGWDDTTWHPSFGDYLFLASTAATAFSPTDTLPPSARASCSSPRPLRSPCSPSRWSPRVP